MKKVLFVSDNLEHYRKPMFESLCKRIELTIAHSSEITRFEYKFSQRPITLKTKGPFTLYENLPDFNEFDIVVLPLSLRCWELFATLFRKRSFKLFIFGIGVSASYNRHYDQSKKHNIIYKYLLKKVDGAIFYDQYPFTKWVSNGIDPEKLSIAYNTVAYDYKFDINKKTFESFLFIGRLYKQKKVFDLLFAYKLITEKFQEKTPLLEIVGDGEEFQKIENWIIEEKLEDKVILHGQLNDADMLRPIFSRSIACISPGQAGLSVQKCFSYGVPFITSNNPITGGESSSIIEGVTGFYYDGTIDGLVNVLSEIASGKADIKDMSHKSHTFYKNFRSVDIWRNGFLQNIDI